MKRFSFMSKALSLLMAMSLCFGFVACSDDDGGSNGNGSSSGSGGNGDTSAPEYGAEAVRYEIQNESSLYSSIELTASGNYIIQKKDINDVPETSFVKSNTKKRAQMGKKTFMTRTSEQVRFLYGKYTKLANGVYNLEDFGTINIDTETSGNVCSLTITPVDGVAETVTASKTNAIADGSMTNSLCRTWKVVKFRECLKVNGNTRYDITYNTMDEFYQKAYNATGDQYYLDELNYYQENPEEWWDELEEVTFTKFGTYIVKYTDNSMNLCYWWWKNSEDGIMEYRETYPDEEDYISSAIIEFKSNQCIVKKYEKWTEDGIEYEEVYYTYMEEVKESGDNTSDDDNIGGDDSDDEDLKPVEVSIIGSWVCVASTGEEIDLAGYVYTFKEDGKVSTTFSLSPTSYSLDGDVLTMYYPNDKNGNPVYIRGIISTYGHTVVYKYHWNDPDFSHECSMAFRQN